MTAPAGGSDGTLSHWPLNPGSQAALNQGCSCPELDNAHGRGYMGLGFAFVISVGCPLHDPRDPVTGRTASGSLLDGPVLKD